VSQARLQEFIKAELSYFAQQHTQALGLEQIVEASTPGKVASLVHKELPYRFAARIRLIEVVENWQGQEELVQLHKIFSDSFSELRLAEPPPLEARSVSVSDLTAYTEVLRNLRQRHRPVVALLAKAIHELDMEGGALQSWADTFLLSRISTEMLTSHYVAVMDSHDPSASRALRRGSVGIVDTKCNPGEICEQAAAAVQVSWHRPGDEVIIKVDTHGDLASQSRSGIEFSYIPQYLFYIVQELLSNSVRATIEAADRSDMPSKLAAMPINVTVCADQKQVVIRISDKGGGVPFGKAEKIWSYRFSTTEQPEEYMSSGSPLAGWGVGLPLGRLYARYLGGSLEIMNVPGTGVDAYLVLRRIAPVGEIGLWSGGRWQTSISDSVANV